MEYQIKKVMDHYEVFVDGLFVVSADTMSEAVKEVEDILKERSREHDVLSV